MDRVCIYPFLFHMESFLGTRAVASILSDKDSESVKYFRSMSVRFRATFQTANVNFSMKKG